MSLTQMVTTALRKSPLAKSVLADIVRELDGKRAAAYRALVSATAAGEREVQSALEAEAAATATLEAAVRDQQQAAAELVDAWQRRTSVVFSTENRALALRHELEALAAPAIARFLRWADEVGAVLMAAPLPDAGSAGRRRHPWDVGARPNDGDHREDEKSLRGEVLVRIREARELVQTLRLSGQPEGKTAEVLAGQVREIRKAARDISALRHSPLMEGDPLAEPEPAA